MVFLHFFTLSTPKTTFNLLPLSQETIKLPISSTLQTVPLVPIGGACASFISSSSTLVPVGNCSRKYFTSSDFANPTLLTALFRTVFECCRTRKVFHQNFSNLLVLITNHSQSKKEASKLILLIDDFFLFCRNSMSISSHFAKD